MPAVVAAATRYSEVARPGTSDEAAHVTNSRYAAVGAYVHNKEVVTQSRKDGMALFGLVINKVSSLLVMILVV